MTCGLHLSQTAKQMRPASSSSNSTLQGLLFDLAEGDTKTLSAGQKQRGKLGLDSARELLASRGVGYKTTRRKNRGHPGVIPRSWANAHAAENHGAVDA